MKIAPKEWFWEIKGSLHQLQDCFQIVEQTKNEMILVKRIDIYLKYLLNEHIFLYLMNIYGSLMCLKKNSLPLPLQISEIHSQVKHTSMALCAFRSTSNVFKVTKLVNSTYLLELFMFRNSSVLMGCRWHIVGSCNAQKSSCNLTPFPSTQERMLKIK